MVVTQAAEAARDSALSESSSSTSPGLGRSRLGLYTNSSSLSEMAGTGPISEPVEKDVILFGFFFQLYVLPDTSCSGVAYYHLLLGHETCSVRN